MLRYTKCSKKRSLMAKQTYPIPKSNPNAYLVTTFFLLWLVNGLIVSLANVLMPEKLVLGTMSLSYLPALLLSSGVLAWIASITMPLFTEIEIRKQMVLAPQHWLLGYLIINIVGIWVVTRFADILGFGVASWMYVIALAIVLDIAQGMTMMAYGEMQKKKS